MEAVSLFRLQRRDAVSSTNDVVKAALEAGEPEGLAVTATTQLGGYGRQGRAWSSPEGGMYLSVLLRPNVALQQLPTLSLAAAVAVRRALASLVPEDVGRRILIKWPNDIVLAGEGARSDPAAAGAPHEGEDARRLASPSASGPSAFQKLVGISLERHADGVCVGIGVNVLPPAEGAAVGGKNAPCYLAELGMEASAADAVEAVRRAVLSELAAVYGQWATEGFVPLLAECERHGALAGHAVAVEDRSGHLIAEGEVRGIAPDGSLLVVDRATGSVRPISSGEAHLRYQLSSS